MYTNTCRKSNVKLSTYQNSFSLCSYSFASMHRNEIFASYALNGFHFIYNDVQFAIEKCLDCFILINGFFMILRGRMHALSKYLL